MGIIKLLEDIKIFEHNYLQTDNVGYAKIWVKCDEENNPPNENCLRCQISYAVDGGNCFYYFELTKIVTEICRLVSKASYTTRETYYRKKFLMKYLSTSFESHLQYHLGYQHTNHISIFNQVVLLLKRDLISYYRGRVDYNTVEKIKKYLNSVSFKDMV